MKRIIVIAFLTMTSHLSAFSQVVNASNVNIDGASGSIKLNVSGNDGSFVGADVVIRRTNTGEGVGMGTVIQMENAGGQNAHIIQGSDVGLQFFNGGASTGTWSERMRIATNGNIGIGTTSPSYKLDVNGTGRFSDILYSTYPEALRMVNNNGYIAGFNSDGTQRTGYIQFYDNSGLIIAAEGGAGGTIPIRMVAGGTDRFSIMPNGNVGVGTASPDAKLRIDANGGTAFKVIGANGYLTIDNVGAGYNYYNANAAHDFQVNGATKLLITSGGNVGIGTSEPGAYKLAVEGIIGARKIKVTQASWADYVFDSSYQLAPLSHVEKFIRENKHLPDVPSAADVKKDGVDIGDNQAILLKKIEELTLYIIQQNKEMKDMRKELEEVKIIQRNNGQR